MRPGVWRLLIAIALLSLAGSARADSLMAPAVLADTQLPDPAQEAAAAKLMATLRCLVCQGQAISDSNAEMAGDMRALVRRKIAAGEKPDDIRTYLVARYGKWVSYDPPLDAETWPLWAMPVLLIGAGIFVARGRFKRRGVR